MRVFGTWYGGANYVVGDVFTDLETWESLADAKRSLAARYYYGGTRRDFLGSVVNFDDDDYAHKGAADSSLRPCVDESTEILLYPARREPAGWRIDTDYPYARLFLGPRGGVREERC